MLGGWPLTDRATFDAIVALVRETDRAAAILACVLLEDHLERKLQRDLRHSDLFETLFGVGRPLNFFGAQNQLAYLMKIYGKPFYRELETIGSIRNKFAHLYSDKEGRFIKGFKSSVIAKLCGQLSLIEPLLEKELERKKIVSGDRRGLEMKEAEVKRILDDPKRKYLETCALCASALKGSLDSRIREAIWADTFPPPDFI